LATYNQNLLTVSERELLGIETIKVIKSILLNIQKLRGFTNFYGFVYTNDTYDETSIQKYKEHINDLIKKLSKDFKTLQEKLEESKDKFELKKDIEHLEEEIAKFNKNVFHIGINHFQKYSSFAQKVISLITEVSDRSYLFSDVSKKKIVVLIDIITNIMPNLMENLGRLRAIGVQSINKKIKSLHDSTQLDLYMHISQNYIERFSSQIDLYIKDLNDIKERDSVLEAKNKILKEVNYFLRVANSDVKQPDIILIDKKYFFDLGEDILSIENQFYNNIFDILENDISSNVKLYSKKVRAGYVFDAVLGISVLSASSYFLYQIF